MSRDDAFEWYRWAAAVNARSDIRPTTARVAFALAGHADNESGTCYPKQSTLALEVGGCTERAVQTAVEELVAMGALTRDPGKGRKSSRYTLVSVEEWQAIARTDVRPIEGKSSRRDTAVTVTHEQVFGAATNGRASLPRTGVRGSHEQVCDRNYSGELLNETAPASCSSERTERSPHSPTPKQQASAVDAVPSDPPLVIGEEGRNDALPADFDWDTAHQANGRSAVDAAAASDDACLPDLAGLGGEEESGEEHLFFWGWERRSCESRQFQLRSRGAQVLAPALGASWEWLLDDKGPGLPELLGGFPAEGAAA